MDAETTSIFEALRQLLERYEQWQLPLREYFASNLHRINRGGYTWDEFDRGRRALEAELKSQSDPDPGLFRLCEQLCSLFLSCDDAGRGRIRARVAQLGRLSDVCLGYARYLTAQINDSKNVPTVQLALAAVLIENCGSDYRDTLTALADLFVRAEEVGMEPRRLFESASELATDSSTTGGCKSLAHMLRNFESCAVVGERRRTGKPYHGE